MSVYPSGVSPSEFSEPFTALYRSHLQHLQLKGLRPKTVDAYARAIRRIGAHFDFAVTGLTPAQLSDYFTQTQTQGRVRPSFAHIEVISASARLDHPLKPPQQPLRPARRALISRINLQRHHPHVTHHRACPTNGARRFWEWTKSSAKTRCAAPWPA